MEFGSGWSLATDGVWQRMEFGNGWSLATDGVWQRMELGMINLNLLVSPMPHAQCPMPNSQFPIHNAPVTVSSNTLPVK
jgi:hypothetical protein